MHSSSAEVALCAALQGLGEKPAERAELLFVYGGMLPEEVAWLLAVRHPRSMVFWLVSELPELPDVLRDAVAEDRLAVAAVDGHVESVFLPFFDPQANLEFVVLDADRVSTELHTRSEAVLMNLREAVRMSIFNAGTLVTKGPLWQNNTLQNLSLILSHPGTEVLDGIFAGRPAVVVGAGPSLTRALPSLKAVRERLVVISTGTALAPLLAAGIRPDLVVAVDGSHLIGKQFDCPCDDLYLVASTLVYTGITRRFKGNFFGLLDLSPIDRWVKSIGGLSGKLYAGGTVTASGMGLAVDMGCDPVFTVGLDLSFERSGASHADGTMYDGNPLRDKMVPVVGNFSETVETTRQFACYIELIQRFVTEFPGTRFVNVNDAGARIEGMELADFSALEAGCAEPFDAYAVVKECHSEPDVAVLENAYGQLTGIVDYLERAQSGCRDAAMALNRLQLMQRNPALLDRDEMKRWMALLREVDMLLDEGCGTASEFLRMSLWPAAYELGADGGAASQENGLNRMRKFYEQIAGAAKWTRELMLRTCREAEEQFLNDRRTTCMRGENHG